MRRLITSLGWEKSVFQDGFMCGGSFETFAKPPERGEVNCVDARCQSPPSCRGTTNHVRAGPREGRGSASPDWPSSDPTPLKNTVSSSTLESLLVRQSTTTFSSCYIALSLLHLSLRATHHIHCFRMPGLDIEPAVIDDTRS